MITRTRIALFVAALAAAAPAAAIAANAVAITPPASASFAVTLDGTDKTGTYSLAIPVAYTSNGNNKFATNGWHITATSTTFKGNTTLGPCRRPPPRSRPSPTASAAPRPTAPIRRTASPTRSRSRRRALAPAPVTTFNATAPSGAGGNTVTMQVSVGIPANTFADVYASTLTLAIIEGP